jgi:protein SCO1/2
MNRRAIAGGLVFALSALGAGALVGWRWAGPIPASPIEGLPGPERGSSEVSGAPAGGSGPWEPAQAESSRPARPAREGSASLHRLRSVWTADDHQRLTLAALEGYYQVLALMFTSCASACPTLVKHIHALDQQLPERIRERTRFVLISIDPERDTPDALRAYRQRMGLDARRWRLLHGAPGDVRELAAVLGFNYGARGGADIAHSRQVTVLNPRGEIIHQRPDAGRDPERLVESIRRAMSSEAAADSRGRL